MRAPQPGADGGGRPGPPASRDDEIGWDAFVAAHPEGTIFHTRAWARIVLAAFPRLRDASLVVPVDDDPCILPLFAWSRAGGLFRTLHSSFPFAYGGPVPARDAAGADLAGRLLPRLSPSVLLVASDRQPFRRRRTGRRLPASATGRSPHRADSRPRTTPRTCSPSPTPKRRTGTVSSPRRSETTGGGWPRKG